MIARDEVVAALAVEDVINQLGIGARPSGAWSRSTRCAAAEHNSDAFAINRASGRWTCHACGTSGDLLKLIAIGNELDIRHDFRKVLELAAAIARVDVDDFGGPSNEPHAQRRAAENSRVARREQFRSECTAEMPARWDQLAREHVAGRSYLSRRGLDPRSTHDLVRYTAAGEPALPLRDLDTGVVVGIQRRRIDGQEPKAPMEFGSRATASALVGRLSELASDGIDVAVLVEGFADTIAAFSVFPGCAIFGSPGAGHLAAIATKIAARLASIRGWLLLVPHVDGGVGEECAADAVIAAERAGLVLDRSIHLVDVRPAKDLADAVRDGFAWRWPS
jgi:hypothetical protein